MTFKAYIDGNPDNTEGTLSSNDAEEVVIVTRYGSYTLHIDGSDLVINCDADFTTIHLEKPRQLRLEAL